MKRLLLACALLGSCVASACLTSAVTSSLFVTVEAQSLPVARTLLWDPNPASDAVTSYTVVQDGASVSVDPASCSASTCALPVAFATAGMHTVSVTATNEWATSPPTTLTINIVVPSAPGKLKLR